METEAHYSTNPLAVITEADSQNNQDLIYKMAEEGFDFLLNTSESTVKEITNHLEGFDVKVYSSTADLSHFKGVEEFYQEILSLGRPIDTLVISPRIPLDDNFSLKINLAEQFDIIRSNTLAPVHLINKVLAEMNERDAGRIIFALSETKHVYPFHQKLIDASRSFLNTYGESLKQELAETNIKVMVAGNEGVIKKLQELASRYLPHWAKTEIPLN
jgi:short-subunit dehydrogenase